MRGREEGREGEGRTHGKERAGAARESRHKVYDNREYLFGCADVSQGAGFRGKGGRARICRQLMGASASVAARDSAAGG